MHLSISVNTFNSLHGVYVSIIIYFRVSYILTQDHKTILSPTHTLEYFFLAIINPFYDHAFHNRNYDIGTENNLSLIPFNK